MAGNGLRIGDGGTFEKRQLNIYTNTNRISNVEFTTVQLSQNPMLPAGIFWVKVAVLFVSIVHFPIQIVFCCENGLA
jgi:hypothetical protein